jgi:hypothetical protein
MNATQLQSAVEKSNELFAKLKEKYHSLKGNMVFSSPYGQCELTTNLAEILNFSPKMIVDCSQKEKGLHLLQKINVIESENKKNSGKPKSSEKFRLQLSDIANNMEIKDDTFVEIRFKGTDLDTIFKIQQDELISQEYTPQTKASIRIVLGTLKDLQ